MNGEQGDKCVPTSNQCVYCGRENGEHNEVCVLADNTRLRAERDDALEILAMALPGPRPWPTESVPAKLRIYREMALDKRRPDETSPSRFTPEQLRFIRNEMNASLSCGATDPLFQSVYDRAKQMLRSSPLEPTLPQAWPNEIAGAGFNELGLVSTKSGAEKAAGGPFARKCDRCKKLVHSRQPVTSTVFYCSIECAE